MHGNRPGCINDRPTGSGVQNMPVAGAIFENMAICIATGCKRAARQFQQPGRRARPIHILDRNAPGAAVSPRTRYPQIAAEIHEQGSRGVFLGQRQCPVDCVFFPYAAKVEFHAGRQGQRWPVPRHAMPTDALEHLTQSCSGRNGARAVERPSPSQRAGRDIEQSVAQVVAQHRVVDEIGGLRVNLDRTPGILVYVRDDARPVPRELGFDAQRLGLDDFPDLGADPVVGCIDKNQAGTRHRGELRRSIMTLRGRGPSRRGERLGGRVKTHT